MGAYVGIYVACTCSQGYVGSSQRLLEMIHYGGDDPTTSNNYRKGKLYRCEMNRLRLLLCFFSVKMYKVVSTTESVSVLSVASKSSLVITIRLYLLEQTVLLSCDSLPMTKSVIVEMTSYTLQMVIFSLSLNHRKT